MKGYKRKISNLKLTPEDVEEDPKYFCDYILSKERNKVVPKTEGEIINLFHKDGRKVDLQKLKEEYEHINELLHEATQNKGSFLKLITHMGSKCTPGVLDMVMALYKMNLQYSAEIEKLKFVIIKMQEMTGVKLVFSDGSGIDSEDIDPEGVTIQ